MLGDQHAATAHADEEENYFVSMTDMMVGVLFIFIIMLMVFALDYRSKTDDQTESLKVAQEVAKKLETLRKEVSEEISALDEAQRTRQRLLQQLKSELETQRLRVEVDEQNGVLRLTEDAVRFDADKATLSDAARQNVARIARVLNDVLPAYAACQSRLERVECRDTPGSTVETVFIEGHTDVTGVKDPDERDRRNWELSTERAVNTYRGIIADAPLLRAMRNLKREEIISVSGYSSARPIDSAERADAWAKNRRIDLRFVMEIESKQRLHEILTRTSEMQKEIERLAKASGG
ncbi:OmpA/MotB family protein [Methylocella tundrae]|uniref:OmpA/MotB domain protein n=1 Tax=Methylocella tundrae TaxID=227605 RepID=A0A4U8Z4Q8_METTU|nr:OmpA family protein [Methylocella tundrae]WPP04208.1 OmpA family protein [Methylocella tundrae]VFU10492.1 OmpA/MotB domain protein [Methylocella tundrae]